MKAIRRRFPVSVASLFLLAMVPAACGGGGGGGNNYVTNPGGGGGGGSTANIAMYDDYYSPKVDTVSAGTTVTWTNDGSNTHTTTANDGTWDSGDVAPGKSYSYKFTTAGSYPYHCKFHVSLGMTGTIVVK